MHEEDTGGVFGTLGKLFGLLFFAFIVLIVAPAFPDLDELWVLSVGFWLTAIGVYLLSEDYLVYLYHEYQRINEEASTIIAHQADKIPEVTVPEYVAPVILIIAGASMICYSILWHKRVMSDD